MKKKFFVIIAAAGISSRMNGINKLFIPINKKPLIIYTLKKFSDFNIILMCNQNYIKYMSKILIKYSINNVVAILSGGQNRSQTIYKALNYIPDNFENIIIHDGARPCISSNLINKLIYTYIKKNFFALAPILKLNDSIKININNKHQSINRDNVFLVQTPQIFKKTLLKNAFNNAAISNKLDFCDETTLLENFGYQTNFIYGDIFNIKITHKQDINFVKKILGEIK